MKNWMLALGLVGMALGWGLFGARQVRSREYECQVRVEFMCFMWEKSDYGNSLDPVDALRRKNLGE